MVEGLRDIHLPPDVSWWPPALGYWLLLGGVLLLLYAAVKYFKKPRMKKEALRILKKIEAEFEETRDGRKCIADLSVLLRRVAITQEATKGGLIGEGWLDYLDQGMQGAEFSRGAGKLLATGPYRPKVDAAQVDEVLNLCRQWVVRR